MTRVCPLCLNIAAVDAAACDCGYVFDSGTDNAPASATVEVVRQAATEDEYRTFYEAQFERAQQQLKSLIARHGTNGWTAAQRDEIQAAIERVETAKTELTTQRRRTQDAKRHLDAAKHRVEIRKMGALANKKI